MLDKYRDYFDIDPEYLAQINEAEIESHPDLWKKFYPRDICEARERYNQRHLSETEALYLGGGRIWYR